mgnify:CR=1 FL=1
MQYYINDSVGVFLSCSRPFLGSETIKQIIARNRFQEILRFIHFAGLDRLYKVRPVLSAVLKNCQTSYGPRKNVAVVEEKIAFKGRVSFRRYLPTEPTKYGIKIWMATDFSNGYVLNFNVYFGSEEGRRRIHGLGYDVVMNMIEPYLSKQQHVFFDNNFSSLDTFRAFRNAKHLKKGMLSCTNAKIKLAC